jgi:hypothetical protein
VEAAASPRIPCRLTRAPGPTVSRRDAARDGGLRVRARVAVAGLERGLKGSAINGQCQCLIPVLNPDPDRRALCSRGGTI